MADDSAFSEAGIVGAAAELFASATKIGLRVAMLPLIAMKDLPFDLGGGAFRASAAFPRAVGKVFDDLADEIAGIHPDEEAEDLDRPGVHTYRNQEKDAAIVLIHGFGQNSQNTWGRFVDILGEDAKLEEWDIFLIGYTTNMMMDVAGLWAASPPIDRLAQYLHTVTSSAPLERYKSLALVAHSMGGLVTQRALVDNASLRQRANHVVFYGTPSGGLKKAGFASGWKRQIRDMAKDSSFITDLRQRWKQVITENPPFELRVVAGDQDELVPTWSSLEPFPERFHSIVIGDHLAIVGPTTRDYDRFKKNGKMHLSVELLVKHVMGEAEPAGPLNSARLAVERSDFRQVINQFEDKVADLDDDALVMLALAYDATGQPKEAIRIIEERGEKSTDLMGVLGGRFKRRWLLERAKLDAERSLELYSKALARAEDAGDHDQIYYHAINVAFMTLATGQKKERVRELAQKALDSCAQTDPGLWRAATEGEANLYLGNADAALEGYQQALDKNPEPRQITSMFQQAVRVAEIQNNEALAKRLRGLFRDNQG